jgi:hypothetical protein
MLFKTIFLSILMFLSFHVAHAWPAQEERQQFCTSLAQVAAQGAAAKNLGYPVKDFAVKFNELAEMLSDPDVGLTKREQREILQAVAEAHAQGGPVAKRMQEAYQTCMTQKQAKAP